MTYDQIFALCVGVYLVYTFGYLRGGTKVREQYQRRLSEEREDHAREVSILKLGSER